MRLGIFFFWRFSSNIGNFCWTEGYGNNKWDIFCQKSIGAVRCILAKSYNNWYRPIRNLEKNYTQTDNTEKGIIEQGYSH